MARPADGRDPRLLPAAVLGLALVVSLLGTLPLTDSAVGRSDGSGRDPNPVIAALRAPAGHVARAPAANGPSGASTPGPVASGPSGLASERGGTGGGGVVRLAPYAPFALAPGWSGFELQHYTVRPGDTLTAIAARYGVRMMTIWWANHLTSKDRLTVGQALVVPSVDGVLYTVRAGDTVEALARRFRADAATILASNGLTEGMLTAGRRIMIPGGTGPALAVATAPVRSVAMAASRPATSTFSFGPLRMPVRGYISQGFGCTGFSLEPAFGSCPHYHGGIDIAAPQGTPVYAAASGVVTLAGWHSGGGGNQIWMNDGHDYYTGYHHLSVVLVHVGQRVTRGQLIGRVGMTGNATGPHLHFEVWIGPIWAGGYRVDPRRYL